MPSRRIRQSDFPRHLPKGNELRIVLETIVAGKVGESSNRNWLDIAVNALLISCSVIGILIPFFEGIIKEKISKDYSTELGWYLGFVLFVSPLIIQVHRAVHRLSSQSKDLISSAFDVQFVGDKTVALDDLKRDILSARSVKNTYIELMPASTPDIDDDRVIKVYSEWLAGDSKGTWEDIVGIKEFFSSRYPRISVANNPSRKHHVYVLREGGKIMNFLILQFEGKRKPVLYFGWLPDDDSNQSSIFRSENDDLVGLFSAYYDYLKRFTWNRLRGNSQDAYLIQHSPRESASLDQMGGTPIKLRVNKSLVDKKGTWISLAYREKGVPAAEAKGTSLRVEKEVVSVAFLDISFDSGFVTVRARSYSQDGEFETNFTAHSECAFFLNNIYIAYKLNRVGRSNVAGICHYQFHRHQLLGDIFRGAYSDSEINELRPTIGFREVFDFESLSDKISPELSDKVKTLKHKISSLNAADRLDLQSGPQVP